LSRFSFFYPGGRLGRFPFRHKKIAFHMTDMSSAVAGAAGHAFSIWIPLNGFGAVAVAAAATAAGRRAIRWVVCGVLTPRDDVESKPEFYSVVAALLRRALVTEDFDATGLHAVSLPYGLYAEECTESLMTCLESLDRETHLEHSLFEFEADYFVDDDAAGEAVLAQTCAVLRRHRHTLRRLKVPRLRSDGAPAFADALAACSAITWLDFSVTTFPFRSWQQLGPTLHTLKLNDLIGSGTPSTTFRLLADNMPALRELEIFTPGEPPSQDGFIELVSRLRSLTLSKGGPYASVTHQCAWPATLPNLEELLWCAGDGVDAVAVAVLRRAVSLRAVNVSHASALATIAMGPVVDVGDGDTGMSAPLSHVRTLTLYAVETDPASLSKTVAASPRASVVQLQWSGSALLSQLWDLLRAVASAASGEVGAGWCRVRRVRLDMAYFSAPPDPEEAGRCVRALFPRVRYASWSAFGSLDVQLLTPPI
jgi:hypothetical protein